MRSSTRRNRRAAAFLAAAALALALGAGCKAMADPDGTDLPWAETHSWETAPNLPGSMLGQ